MAETRQDLAGMTLNERLFVCGLMDDWNDAIERRDQAAMVALLVRVEVSDPQWVAATALSNRAADGA